MSTLFSKIIAGEIPVDKVFENDNILAFKDIKPMAPVHILIIPKMEGIKFVDDLNVDNTDIIAEMILVAKKLARDYGIDKSGYRIVTNCGKDSGQEVFHLHFHLLGGKKLGAIA